MSGYFWAKYSYFFAAAGLMYDRLLRRDCLSVDYTGLFVGNEFVVKNEFSNFDLFEPMACR